MKLGNCLHGNQVRSSHKIDKIIIILHKTLSGESYWKVWVKCQVTNLPNSPAYELAAHKILKILYFKAHDSAKYKYLLAKRRVKT